MRCRFPIVGKLVCFPFAACLPWSANVMESTVKQLELHLGPSWNCCNLQAPVRTEIGGCRWGAAGWATKQLVLSPPWAALGAGRAATPEQLLCRGAVHGACSVCLGELLLWADSQCWSQWMLWWNPGLFYNSACCWSVQWQPAKGELLSKVHLIFLKSITC